MIIFDLICEHEHRFEGWFRAALEFQHQLDDGLLRCPECDSASVRKLPSAVSISSQRAEPVSEPPSSGSSSSATSTLPSSPTQLLSLYKQLTSALLAVSEDVGVKFAQEARRIHEDEVPARPIHGRATPDELGELAEEGIAVFHLPVIENDDLN